MHDHIAWTFLGDRGVQRNVRSRFRPHRRIAGAEASILIEFTVNQQFPGGLEPPITVGLSFCSAAFHDDSLFTAMKLTALKSWPGVMALSL